MSKLIPEKKVRIPRNQVGFVPNRADPVDNEELWQLWCRSDNGDEWRAKESDVNKFGFRRSSGRRNSSTSTSRR